MGGPDFRVSEGDIVDWPKNRADHFLACGYVEMVDPPEEKHAEPKKAKAKRKRKSA